jgi:glycosyltransferase involved in cell wall biosynthesis
MARNGLNVAIYDPSSTGGITHYTFQLAESLVRAGCRVTLITSEDYELKALQRRFDVWYLFKPSRLRAWVSRLRAAGAPNAGPAPGDPSRNTTSHRRELAGSVLGALRSLRLMAVLLRAALKLRRDGTDIVHVHWLLDRRADRVFVRTLRRFGIRVVHTVHDVLPHDAYTAQNKAFFQRLYRYPDKLIVHSENNRREMLDLFPIDPQRLCVVPHGRHGIFFECFGTSVPAARDRLAIPSGTKVILFFGLIKRYKGLEHLLQAFDTISAQRSDVLLLIAGRTPDNDPESRRHYEPMLAHYVSRPNVRFADAYVPFDRVADYFLAADLVVIPYTKASQSGVLLTAYAAASE